MQLITNSNQFPVLPASLDKFDLIQVEDQEFDYYELVIDEQGQHITPLEQVEMSFKAEQVKSENITMRTKSDTYAEYGSLTIRKKIAQTQKQKASLEQLDKAEVEQILSQLKENTADSAKMYQNYPPFNLSATQPAEVFPLNGLLCFNVAGFIKENPNAVSQIFADSQDLNDPRPMQLFDNVLPCKALSEFAPLCGVNIKPSPEGTLMCGLIGAYKRVQVPFANKYINLRVKGNAVKNPKAVGIILALALHVFNFQVSLKNLSQDLKVQQKEIEQIARGMGLQVDNGVAKLKTPWVPGQVQSTRERK
ncbi:Conserved_hypothetical protein [Hexamita inflata]|uniref:Uncharacterized protein n=1 Tax=Hexamita inflata TaxID=28002 RepID=A0AA86URL2_9EUKA|nr:Conserved hypothetical protein [Hexamita inflata]